MQLKNTLNKHTKYRRNENKGSNRSRKNKTIRLYYPIFDTNYKAIFETHFIRNFYTREIGFETEGLFKFKLENWLSINMGYFNKMFESELLTFDPLINVRN
jgi:hypothetical protein